MRLLLSTTSTDTLTLSVINVLLLAALEQFKTYYKAFKFDDYDNDS